MGTLSTATASSVSMQSAAAPVASRLEGKTAVVTCGTDGIGFATARRLCQEGAKVTICGARRDAVDTAVQYLVSEGFAVSGAVLPVGTGGAVTPADGHARLLRLLALLYEKLDFIVVCDDVVPCAARGILDVDEESWRESFDMVLKRSFFMVRALKPVLANPGGAVVFMSSMLGYAPLPGFAVASVTNATILALTKALAAQWAPIRVNCVTSGVQSQGQIAQSLQLDKFEKVVKELVPLGRLAQPDDCAAAVAFLCSADGDYISGEAIVVAGGVPSRL